MREGPRKHNKNIKPVFPPVPLAAESYAASLYRFGCRPSGDLGGGLPSYLNFDPLQATAPPPTEGDGCTSVTARQDDEDGADGATGPMPVSKAKAAASSPTWPLASTIGAMSTITAEPIWTANQPAALAGAFLGGPEPPITPRSGSDRRLSGGGGQTCGSHRRHDITAKNLAAT